MEILKKLTEILKAGQANPAKS